MAMIDLENTPCYTIEIFRNAGFVFPLQLNNPSSYGVDVTNYKLAFVICPKNSDGTLGTPVIYNNTPVVTEPGTVWFQLSQGDTNSLAIGTGYEFRVLLQPPGQNPSVQAWGYVVLRDAPSIR